MSDVSSLEQRAWINPGISGYLVESLEDVIPVALELTTENSKEPGTQESGLVWFYWNCLGFCFLNHKTEIEEYLAVGFFFGPPARK